MPTMRGGWRQRLAQLDRDRERSRSDRLSFSNSRGTSRSRSRSRSRRRYGRKFSKLGESEQATALLSDWAWMKLSAKSLQRFAASSVRDGCTLPLVQRLSRLGASGAQPQHINAQLITLFKSQECFNLVTTVPDSRQMCMIDPHIAFKFCFDKHRGKFRRHWGADRDNVAKFWTDTFATEMGRELRELHPDLRGRTVDELSTSIPLSLHNDAGPFSKKQSVFVLSVGSMLGVGSELETRSLVATWVKGCFTDLPELVYDRLGRSFVFLARGWADAGVLLASEGVGGLCWKGILATVLSDMEFLHDEVGLRGAGMTHPCAWCPCNRTDMPFTALGTSALWRRHRFSNDEFLAHIRDAPRHPLLNWPMVNRQTFRLDTLHIVDYHGVISCVAANTLWTIVCDSPLFPADCRTQLARFAALTQQKDAFFQNQNRACALSGSIDKNLLFPNGKSSKTYPALSGPRVKAANSRALMPWIAAISIAHDDGTLPAVHRRICAVNLNEYLRIIYSEGFVLSTAAMVRLEKVVFRCLRSYSWLQHNAISSGRVLWHVIPKWHYWAELVYQSRLFNPRFCQTYAGESLVGRVSTLYKRSCTGPFHKTIQHRVLRQYVIGLSIAMSNRTGL